MNLRATLERLEARQLLAVGDDLIWAASPGKPIFAKNAPQPTQFASFSLVKDSLRPRLESAPLEFALGPEEPADLRPNRIAGELTLPRPDGTLREFTVVQTAVMDEALAAKLTEVATYHGYTTTGDYESVRITVSPSGLHAQVRSAVGTYIVDPVAGDLPDAYMSFFTSDMPLSEGDVLIADDEDHQRDLGDNGGGDDNDDLPPGAPPSPQTTASELRTYRIAVAATFEFTTRHGGTVAAAQAKIVEALNDTNGLYEEEASIRFQVIDNTDIIYTNSNDDPYTGLGNSAMLPVNQTNLDNVIGNANYDIGHVFGTNGGGIASVGVVGRTGLKARGVSGNNLNTNAHTVAHEIGHQFGSRHTWNGSQSSCSATQWNADFSMEPGSGSTILSYGGFCGTDNVVTTRDFYFHSVSYDAIVNHAQNVIPGVGTITATGNTAPQVDAGPAVTIPAATPFFLDAPPATDAEGDPLQYNWEQRDLGSGQKALSDPDDGLGPLFRSYPKDADPTRTIPRLSNLLNNSLPLGEQLPTTDRQINFRLNVNDGRGGTASDVKQITVKQTGTPFAITSPNTAVDWPALSTQTVAWNVAGTNANGIDVNFVDILLSTDGGNTFNTVLASSIANDGSQELILPDVLSTAARVKVQPVGNIFFDISDANFTISEAIDTTDYGDAPSVYGVLQADGGAVHTVGGPLLGAAVDTEADGQPSALATGDGADEDGVSFVDLLIAGQIANVSVTASQAAKLDLFIDFDGNQVFGNNASEIIRVDLVAGSQLIPVLVPSNAVDSTFSRFRVSTLGGLSPNGPAADGEVEDYQVSIFQTPPDLDFGDAQNYASLIADDGARHILGSGLVLGSFVDEEPDALVNAMSTGDGRDEDGVVFKELFTPGVTSGFDVTASAAGALDFFIDFDRDGTFGNVPDEVFSQAVIAGTQRVEVAVPPSTAFGVTQSRFRLSTVGGLAATGLAGDGEVEDYQLVIADLGGERTLGDFDDVAAPQLPLDWNSTQLVNFWRTVTDQFDSPSNAVFVPNLDEVYDVRLDSRAFTVEVPDTEVRFKNFYDTESTYDGGVLEITIDGGAFEDILDAGGTFVSGGYNASINNGFSNPLSGRSAWSGDSMQFIDTIVRLPNSMVGKDVVMRWRHGSDSSVDSTGWWIDSVRYDGATVGKDFGDAGDSYPTLFAGGGASHLVSSLMLGDSIDAEPDGQPTTAADGDDNGGSDDESGVIFPETLTPGTNVVSVTSSAAAILNVWIDTNIDGDWDDPADHVIKALATVDGVNSIPIALLPSMTPGSTVARVRLSDQAGLAPGGEAGDGEVEDYVVVLNADEPTTVNSISINAGQTQRSAVTEIEIAFDDSVAYNASAFGIRNRADGSLVLTDISSIEAGGKTIVTLEFLPGANVVTRATKNSLADGWYELSIDSEGVSGMTEDYLLGDDPTDAFFRLFGDGDGDQDVDIADYGQFVPAFNAPPSSGEFNENLDFDGDDDIDGIDFSEFRRRLSSELPF